MSHLFDSYLDYNVTKRDAPFVTRKVENLKALITGASSGIGRDMARELAKRAYDLVLVAKDKQRLDCLAQELIKTNSIRVDTIAMDLSLIENCKELHRRVKNVDVLINNAGFGECGDFTKTSLDKEIDMIHTNIVAYHVLMKLYLIDMKKRGYGKVLNVASIAGFMPGPLMSTYYATKAYIVRISESVREELKREKSKVEISILCPGPVNTNFDKVANVEFHLRQASSKKVAKIAIQKMEQGKFYIVPGLDVKFAKVGAKLLPSSFISKITYVIQKRKVNK